MKNKLLKLSALAIATAMTAGLAFNQQRAPQPVAAEQHIANYDLYSYIGNYYDDLDTRLEGGMNGKFREALTSLIHPTSVYTYKGTGSNTLSEVLQGADEDPDNPSNMIYFYTRDSVKKNAASTWNREHVWPQSLSNGHYGTGRAGADLLHIRPTYNTTNSTRGSLLMADINKSSPVTYNGMTYGYKTSGKFEPLDAVKGDVARIFMYVWVAYRSEYSSSPMNMLSAIESYDTLLKWHTQDKPDVLEGNRNDYAESSKQGNRNPFVDHPDFAWKVFGDMASASVREACQEAYPASENVPDEKTVVSIAITGNAIQKEYYAGESFNPAGLTVTATYDDSSTKAVSLNSCKWTPDPLTEETTSVTCTYSGKTATYSGITVTKKQTIGGDYSIEFKSSGADGSSVITNEEISEEYIVDNTLVKSIDTASRIYPGKTGLKMGSSSNPGKISFELNENATANISSIEITSAKYGSDGGRLKVTLGSDVIDDEIVPEEEYIKMFANPVTASTLTIETTTKRAYLLKITITIEGDVDDDDDDPPSSSSSEESSSSEVPSSSEESSSSIPESSSSIEPSSSEESSSELPSSSEDTSVESSSSEETSVIPSSSEESSEESSSEEPSSSTTPVVPSSSEQPSSSSSNPAYEESSSQQESSSEKETPKSNGLFGCNGSIISVISLASLSSLIGLIFIFSKKKQ